MANCPFFLEEMAHKKPSIYAGFERFWAKSPLILLKTFIEKIIYIEKFWQMKWAFGP